MTHGFLLSIDFHKKLAREVSVNTRIEGLAWTGYNIVRVRRNATGDSAAKIANEYRGTTQTFFPEVVVSILRRGSGLTALPHASARFIRFGVTKGMANRSGASLFRRDQASAALLKHVHLRTGGRGAVRTAYVQPVLAAGVSLLAALVLTCPALAQPAQPAVSEAQDEQALLRSQIIDLGPGYAQADASIQEFAANNANIGAGPAWHVNIPARDAEGLFRTLVVHIRSQPHDYGPSQSDPTFALKTSTSTIDGQRIFVMENSPPGKPGPLSFGVPQYGVTMKMDVPGCNFKAETCYPASTITVPPDASAVTLTVAQPGLASLTVAPGGQVTFDRSLGGATVTVAEVQGFTFPPLSFALRLNEGPEVRVPADVSHEVRFKTYRALAQIQSQIRLQNAAPDPNNGLYLKTLHTQARMISANAIKQKYADIARALLVSRAQDLGALDAQVLAVRRLVIANASLSPDDVDVTIARIDALLADPTTASRDTLTKIRQELVRARDAVGQAGGAISVVQANLISSVDAQIADYQTLVLEYAQYVDSDTLSSAIPANAKARINAGLSPNDVHIADSVLGGRGASIRAASGLPNP